MDEELKFKEHIASLVRKGAQQINALQRLRRFVDLKTREIMFKSFISANFRYCPLVWMFAGKTDLEKLERIQQRAIRLVYNDHSTDIETLYSRIGCTSIQLSNMRTLAIEIYKCLNGMSPGYIKDLFIKKNTPYVLRADKRQPKVNTTKYGLNTIRY